MAIVVDTAKVALTANQIASINRTIKSDFSEVEAAITNLDRNWDGNASNTGITSFNKMKDSFVDSRYNVLNNLVTSMNQLVSEGYERVESTVQSAASAFK